MKRLLLLTLLPFCTSCIFPYKSDFDCRIPEGEHCQSLSEIDVKVRSGQFRPENRPPENKCLRKRCPCKQKRSS